MVGRNAEQGVRLWLVKLVWTRLTSLDRQEIREYIAQDNPAAAVALDALISEKVARLIDHPGLGRPIRVAGMRELIAHQNYIILGSSGEFVGRNTA